MEKNRIVYLDFIAGLLILYMIFPVHVLSQTGLERYNYLSSVFFFFMAWFFYKAGMFFKPTDCKTVLKKTFKRLIVPFFCLFVYWRFGIRRALLFDGCNILQVLFRLIEECFN